jgi:hypothetical protein
LYFLAESMPTMALARSFTQAFFCSSGISYSGYIRSQLAGSTAMLARKLVTSW